MTPSPTFANCLYDITLSLHPGPEINLPSHSWMFSPLLPTFNQASPWTFFYTHGHIHPLFSPDYFQLLLTGFLVPSSVPTGSHMTICHHPSLAQKALVNQHCLSDNIKGSSMVFMARASYFPDPSIRIPFNVSIPGTLNSLLFPETTTFHFPMPLFVLPLLLFFFFNIFIGV